MNRGIKAVVFAISFMLAWGVLGTGTASAHLHPFNPAAACAPSETGAGNEATAFFTAKGVQEHWNMEDLLPGVPGIQFLIQISNPGKADTSSGAIAVPGIFIGNPGVAKATAKCA